MDFSKSLKRMSLAVVFGSIFAACSYGQAAVKNVIAGAGLAGGGSTQTVTIFIPTGGISYNMLSSGAVAQLQVAGPQGPVGPQGPQGEAGPTGPAGATGPKGETGAQGPQGTVGPVGPIGIVGPQGPVGPKGETGAQGPVGPSGPQGAKGETGAQGPQGNIGPIGPIGAIGPQGPKGDKGDAGNTGNTGPQGIQGPKGDPGDSGAAGSTGAQGPKGDTGDTGPQGPKGDKGDQGIQGPQGPAGAAIFEHFANKNDLVLQDDGQGSYLPDQTFVTPGPSVLRFHFTAYFDHFDFFQPVYSANVFVHTSGGEILVDTGHANEFPGNSNGCEGTFISRLPALQDVSNGDPSAYFVLRVSNIDNFDEVRTETTVTSITP